MSRRRRSDSDAGVTTVEFALVLPVFLVLMSIGTYFAWMAYTQAQVDRAASRAARFAAVPTTDGSYGYCQGLIVAQLNAALVSGSVTTTDVKVSDGTGVALAGTEAATTEAACDALNTRPSGFVKVTLTRNFTNPFSLFLAPFTGTSNDLTVTGTGEVRVEHP
ncbi:MAG: hypothetical protein JWL79_1126 [Frankiales bacterium]|nr:hypothetical protein [Frankiales bacterium]